ncbi:MAG TPA: hypothetical protein DIW31_10605, partial [Bacteroidales bacterium]|nr:hypothetical protein [Bacteroidales bacterium]
FENGIQIGTLSFAMWTNKAKGILNDKEFEYRTKGFFKPETEIGDLKNGNIVGKITYNEWKTKATITLIDGRVCEWQYQNFWHTRWALNQGLYFINYKSSMLNGEITSHLPDEVLIITGLFVFNFFSRSHAATAAAAT